MIKSTKKAGLVVKSSLKSGGIATNHNRPLAQSARKAGLTVKAGLKSGGIATNHCRSMLTA